ncbi:MAG: Peptidase, (Acylaminoacyl-peptidase) family, partial [Blastococcus sp.]|nr:Peptidase, (Acylaminoacyl-peptidase) family [Blastococcus sp.]
ENIRAALDGELSFYAQVWGFDLPAAEGIEPIELKDPPAPHRSHARGGPLQEGR